MLPASSPPPPAHGHQFCVTWSSSPFLNSVFNFLLYSLLAPLCPLLLILISQYNILHLYGGVGGVPLELCSEELWEFSERPWDTPSLSSSLSSSFYLLGSWERFFLKKSFPGFKKGMETSGLVFARSTCRRRRARWSLQALGSQRSGFHGLPQPLRSHRHIRKLAEDLFFKFLLLLNLKRASHLFFIFLVLFSFRKC